MKDFNMKAFGNGHTARDFSSVGVQSFNTMNYGYAPQEYERAKKLAQSLFNNKFEDLTKQDIADLFDEQDMKEVNVDISIVDIVISVGAASSKREAREFITSGAVSLNGNKITDINQIISADMFIDNTYVIIKRGKKNYYVGKKI